MSESLQKSLSWSGPMIFVLGLLLALFSNIKVGAITMGLSIILIASSDAMRYGWRRPVAIIAPLIVAVALITVALLLPRSSL